jgi:hypothetical protein
MHTTPALNSKNMLKSLAHSVQLSAQRRVMAERRIGFCRERGTASGVPGIPPAHVRFAPIPDHSLTGAMGRNGLAINALDRVERLLQVGNQVVRVLDSDRKSHQGVADAQLGPHIGRHRPVRHQGWVLDETFDTAQALGQRE